jgi:hypothetical protein
MRFDELTYSHKEENINVTDLIFNSNIKSEDDLTVEIWMLTEKASNYDRSLSMYKDDIAVVIVNEEICEYEAVTEQEREFVLKFAKEKHLI